jgi:ATP-dependent RNA helicase RhlE
MNQFTELTLHSCLHTNLARNSFQQPTPVQAESIPHALSGVDLVATAQTGTGKTLAFLLPAMERLLREGAEEARKPAVRVLVLSPTRELAMQIADTFHKLAPGTQLRSAVVVGGLGEQGQLNAIRRGAQFVIATPGRLEDFLSRNLVDLSKVSTLVLDEADRMLDMGFLPAIERILGAVPKGRQSLFFSATMEKAVERLIARHSKDPVRVAVGSAVTKLPPEVDLHAYEVESDVKFCLLRHMLQQEVGSFLVFARTKHSTDRLAKKLSAAGVRAVAMHGDRTQNQRNQALAGFRDGRYRVLVATDVAARGIHVDSVAHVVNFDLPQAPDDFVHRVGRTGRAGQRGSASTFYVRSERSELRRIERECKVRLEPKQVAPEVFALHLAEKNAPPVAEHVEPAHVTPEHVRHHAAPKHKAPHGRRPSNSKWGRPAARHSSGR